MVVKMKKKLEIKTNVKYSELKIYKRKFVEEEISETPFFIISIINPKTSKHYD